MEITIDQALEQGVAAHLEGKLQEAEQFYRAILQVIPAHPDANHNLGVLTAAVGSPLEALPFFERAVEANPRVERAWVSYIDALIAVERFDEAERVLAKGEQSCEPSDEWKFLRKQIQTAFLKHQKSRRQGLPLSEKRKKLAEKKKNKKMKAYGQPSLLAPSHDQVRALLECYQAGRSVEAESLSVSLTNQFPQHPFGWKVLGLVLRQAGRLYESLAPLQKSVRLSPEDAEAHSNLGVTLQELGRLDAAEESYRQAISLNEGYAEAHYNLGVTLQALGRLDSSLTSYRRAISLKPEYAEAYTNLGIILRKLGRLEDAESSFRKAIARKPDYVEAHSNLGVTLQDLGRLEAAAESYGQAIALKPEYAKAHYNLGVTLRDLGKLEAAIESYRQAISLKPAYAKAHSNLGVTLQDLGRLDEAEASYGQAIMLKPNFAEAHRNKASIKKFSSRDEQFALMQTLYQDPTISDDSRCHICFALAKACDDIGELSDAFQFYEEGNSLRRKQLSYDKEQEAGLFERVKKHNASIAAHAPHQQCDISELVPVFIVGMPRSGTTLVEQIVSSHPLVKGAGELPFVSQFGGALAFGKTLADREALAAFREKYLDLVKQISAGNSNVTDKMPQNFRFLGLIAATFPEARIIHVKRDPAAVCWANYTQYFVDESLAYCYAIEDILHYFDLYQDLMTYWHEALPNRIYDLDYEVLTEHQEQETRKLIDHLDLAWNEACLSPQDNTRGVATASNVQVRQNVYQGSSQKWKLYRPYLNGALDHFSSAH